MGMQSEDLLYKDAVAILVIWAALCDVFVTIIWPSVSCQNWYGP